MHPRVSGAEVVWQERYNIAAGKRPAARAAYGAFAGDPPINPARPEIASGLQASTPTSTPTPIALATDLDQPPLPAISGNAVVWQEHREGTPVWTIQSADLRTLTPVAISTALATAVVPDVSREHIVWQQNVATPSGTPDLDIFANVPVPTATPTATVLTGGITDVPPDSPYYTAIMALLARGVISGYADHTFRPANPVTRGQICKIVVLAEGWPFDTSGGPHFTDVPPSDPFYKYIETALHHGVVAGYRDYHDTRTFRPSNNVTRGQIVKVVVGAAGWDTDFEVSPHFADVPPGHPFFHEIETAYRHGIISGYTCGQPGEPCNSGHQLYFRSANSTSRGQAAKIVYGLITRR
jgi:hypothetical protein